MTYTLDKLNAMMEQNGGSLDLRGCTGLTSLPEGLTVGGSLDLHGCTGLTSLPEGLTVGGALYLGDCTISNPRAYKRLQDGDYVPGRYIYADGMLTHIKRRREMQGYIWYAGKIPGRNVISDGVHYAHCATFRDGVADLQFKADEDRGAEQYRGINMDKPMPVSECMTMYRIITGACRAGTQAFVDGIEDLREAYTVREIIGMVEGAYGGETFRRFFGEENE